MTSAPQPVPAARFARLIAALCDAVGARVAGPSRPGLAGPLIILIWTRLRRMADRVTRLAARVEAGKLKPPSRRPAAPRRATRPPDRVRLPRGGAWLVRLVPASSFGAAQLQALLADPEMAALIAAAPRIGRTLRPLCQMLGVSLPPALRLPPPAPPAAAGGRRPAAEPPGAGPSPPQRPPPPSAPWRARRACGPPLPAANVPA